MLNKEELIFIIDFLINLCKHCQIFDNLAVSLGTHLLPDLYDKTNRRVLQVVKQESAELLYINFDLRFKHFMRKFALYNRMLAQLHKLSVQHHWNQSIPPPIPEDELFSSLFSQVYSKLTDPGNAQKALSGGSSTLLSVRERSMDVYATHFLKTIIKILQ
jgi:hypothetical protein